MSSHPKVGDGRASCVELRPWFGEPSRGRVLRRRLPVACGGGAASGALRGPLRCWPGVQPPPKWRAGSGVRPQGGDPKVASRLEPTEVGSGAQDTQREPDDTSHGVRFLSARRATVVVTSVCLTDAVRPQGFSPSRRFDPTGAVWLCFTPLPPIGFWPSELFPPNQPRRLSTPVALMSSGQRRRASRPARHSPRLRLPSRGPIASPCRTSSSGHPCDPRTRRRHQPRVLGGKPLSHHDERSTPALKRRRRTPREASTGSASDQRSSTRTGENPDSRALLRLSSRSPSGTVRHPIEADALLAFTPSEVYQPDRWARALPSRASRFEPRTRSRRSTATTRNLAPQGVDPVGPGKYSEKHSQPP
jgi:hypothetical protein